MLVRALSAPAVPSLSVVSADGRLVYTSHESELRVFTVKSGALLKVITHGLRFVTHFCVRTDQDKESIFVSTKEGEIYTLAEPQPSLVAKVDGGVFWFSPVSDGILVSNDQGLCVVLSSGECQYLFKGAVSSCRLVGFSVYFVSNHRVLSFSDYREQMKSKSEPVVIYVHKKSLSCLCINPVEPTQCSVGDASGAILTLSGGLSSGRCAVTRRHWHSSVVTSLAYSADGQLLLSGSTDGVLCVWKGSPVSVSGAAGGAPSGDKPQFLPRLGGVLLHIGTAASSGLGTDSTNHLNRNESSSRYAVVTLSTNATCVVDLFSMRVACFLKDMLLAPNASAVSFASQAGELVLASSSVNTLQVISMSESTTGDEASLNAVDGQVDSNSSRDSGSISKDPQHSCSLGESARYPLLMRNPHVSLSWGAFKPVRWECTSAIFGEGSGCTMVVMQRGPRPGVVVGEKDESRSNGPRHRFAGASGNMVSFVSVAEDRKSLATRVACMGAHAGYITGAACVTVDGQDLFFTGSIDGCVHAWAKTDKSAFKVVKTLRHDGKPCTALSIGTIDEQASQVLGSDQQAYSDQQEAKGNQSSSDLHASSEARAGAKRHVLLAGFGSTVQMFNVEAGLTPVGEVQLHGSSSLGSMAFDGTDLGAHLVSAKSVSLLKRTDSTGRVVHLVVVLDSRNLLALYKRSGSGVWELASSLDLSRVKTSPSDSEKSSSATARLLVCKVSDTCVAVCTGYKVAFFVVDDNLSLKPKSSAIKIPGMLGCADRVIALVPSPTASEGVLCVTRRGRLLEVDSSGSLTKAGTSGETTTSSNVSESADRSVKANGMPTKHSNTVDSSEPVSNPGKRQAVSSPVSRDRAVAVPVQSQ